MKEQVKQSAKHFDNMDVVDRAQQDAIESIADRVEMLIWVICVSSIIFGATIIFLLADRLK